MRLPFIFVAAVMSVAAQIPVVTIANTTRPGKDFQVGDRFEIVVTGVAKQPVSVRTTRQGSTDWSPVVGWTDTRGRWSTTGQFEKADFGGWNEAWTVGVRLTETVVSFSVGAPCIPGGRSFMSMSGAYSEVLSCDTAAGIQTFSASSDPFRTPDGRLVSGETPEQYLGNQIENSGGPSGQHGDDAGAFIAKVIGANVLSDRETRNVLSIIRLAFQNRFVMPPTNNPATLLLLRNLAGETEDESLKKEIAETVAFVLTQ